MQHIIGSRGRRKRRRRRKDTSEREREREKYEIRTQIPVVMPIKRRAITNEK